MRRNTLKLAALCLLLCLGCLLYSGAQPTLGASETVTLKGHRGEVFAVAWSPDGKTIASADHNSEIRLWDAQTGAARVISTGQKLGINGLAWSPDSKQIISAASDATLKLWDAETGKSVAVLSGHKDAVRRVAWSPDGKLIAAGSSDKTVILWDAVTAKALKTLGGTTSGVDAVVWSPDSKQIAVAAFDTVTLWDVETGKSLLNIDGLYLNIAWSPDGKTIAGTRSSGVIQLVNAGTGRAIKQIGSDANVKSLAWSPEGDRIATGNDKTARVWDVKTGLKLGSLDDPTNIVSSVSWSPDGDRLAVGGWEKLVWVWDVSAMRIRPPATATAAR